MDYALRAASELAAADAPRTVEQLSAAQDIPNKYLESILGELRRGGLLRSQRELANVSGSRPEDLDYSGAASALQQVLIALRASERTILEGVTLAHVSSGELPEFVSTLVANPAAWT